MRGSRPPLVVNHAVETPATAQYKRSRPAVRVICLFCKNHDVVPAKDRVNGNLYKSRAFQIYRNRYSKPIVFVRNILMGFLFFLTTNILHRTYDLRTWRAKSKERRHRLGPTRYVRIIRKYSRPQLLDPNSSFIPTIRLMT